MSVAANRIVVALESISKQLGNNTDALNKNTDEISEELRVGSENTTELKNMLSRNNIYLENIHNNWTKFFKWFPWIK